MPKGRNRRGQSVPDEERESESVKGCRCRVWVKAHDHLAAASGWARPYKFLKSVEVKRPRAGSRKEVFMAAQLQMSVNAKEERGIEVEVPNQAGLETGRKAELQPRRLTKITSSNGVAG